VAVFDNAVDRVTERTIAASNAATDFLVTVAATGTVSDHAVALANVAATAGVLSGTFTPPPPLLLADALARSDESLASGAPLPAHRSVRTSVGSTEAIFDNTVDWVTEATIAASDTATDALVTVATTGTVRHDAVALANVATVAGVLSGAFVAFATTSFAGELLAQGLGCGTGLGRPLLGSSFFRQSFLGSGFVLSGLLSVVSSLLCVVSSLFGMGLGSFLGGVSFFAKLLCSFFVLLGTLFVGLGSLLVARTFLQVVFCQFFMVTVKFQVFLR